MYKHVPKTGGTSYRDVLLKAKKTMALCYTNKEYCFDKNVFMYFGHNITFINVERMQASKQTLLILDIRHRIDRIFLQIFATGQTVEHIAK